VYRADWRLAGSGEVFVGKGKVRDTLDVADIQSEDEHDYEMRLPLIGLEPENIVLRESYPSGRVVVDAGRRVPGSEEFTVGNLSAGRPLRVVLRTTNAPFILQVHADGEFVGEWSIQPSGRGWQEATFTIPAQYVRTGTLRVRLSPPEDTPLATHTAYHYWFVQRR